MKMLTRTGPLFVPGLQLDFVPLTTTICIWLFSQFLTHITVCSSSLYKCSLAITAAGSLSTPGCIPPGITDFQSQHPICSSIPQLNLPPVTCLPSSSHSARLLRSGIPEEVLLVKTESNRTLSTSIFSLSCITRSSLSLREHSHFPLVSLLLLRYL